jgi:hypothetical protein
MPYNLVEVYQTTRRYILEDSNVYSYCRETSIYHNRSVIDPIHENSLQRVLRERLRGNVVANRSVGR